MSQLVFLAHFPLLRIDADSIPFAAGDLWRMPFEAFDDLTLGAFSDHRARFEETAPVFYRVQGELPLPMLGPRGEEAEPGKRHAIELKMPSGNWEFLNRLDLGFMVGFHEVIADAAWTAMLLAAPATALPRPRVSVSFAVSVDEDVFHMGEMVSPTVRVQGDADMEFVLLAEAAGTPVPAELIAKASELLPAIEGMLQVPELRAAIESLQVATTPALYPSEQLTLSVVALEALLLPEVRSGLGATFARRLSGLLAANSAQRELLQSVGRHLYDLRSVGLHGGAPDAAPAIDDAHGQQLLAAAIVTLARRKQPLDQVRGALDDDHAVPTGMDARLPLRKPPGLRAHERLLRSTTEQTAGFITSVSSLEAQEGTLLSWSPLVGLGIDKEFQLGQDGAPLVISFDGQEVLSLEDKDIRRDFVAELRMSAQPVAVLAIVKNAEGERSYERYGPNDLLRQRDLAVASLRLSGFTNFHDPELLGSFVYEGKLRYRRATVLRQTILEELRHEPEQRIGPSDAVHTGLFWHLLKEYDGMARHPDVDSVLVMFRRACDRRFLPVNARAGLMFSVLEAMLGRSRPPKERIQLDTLVTRIAGGDSAATMWFAENGRTFRNAVAHGHWDFQSGDQQPLEHMATILRVVLPAFVRCWVELGDRTADRPGRAFIKQVMENAAAGRA